MERRYYLSKFIGDGKTRETSFKPKVSEYDKGWGIIDLRSDPTQRVGWCFTYLDSNDHVRVETDPDIIVIGKDAHTILPGEVTIQLKKALETEFSSQTLADILMELLLKRPGFRPNVEGKYQIYLGSLLKELTREEALVFISRVRPLSQSGHQAESNNIHKERPPIMDHVKAALDNIKRVVEIGKTGWLDEVLADQSKISHPLVANFGASQKAITNGETALNGSHAVIWVMMLARDLQTVLSLIDTKLIAVRLRSPGDVESTKYELFVMAGYYEAGIQVEKTDINKTGEFRIKTGNGYVFIECKHKTAESIRERNIKEIYELGTKELYHLMDRLKKPCIIHITTNTDPKERDLTILMELVEQGLSRDIGSGVRNRRGKYQVLILPSEWGMHSDQSATGVRAPGGYEYAETEAVLREDATGKRIATGTRGIAWYSARPSDWLRSAIDSFRKAAEQLPKNDCGLIYLDLPEGDENILRVRMDMVSKELQRLLTQHQRINVIVLTGLSTVFGYSGPGIATTRVLYKVIYNPRPRLALPSGFKVFGDHFTRKRQ